MMICLLFSSSIHSTNKEIALLVSVSSLLAVINIPKVSTQEKEFIDTEL